ncbi:ribosome maturation factor RimP [Chitinivibrio alkaliphilus]|uniref:Ribosome maturation factor RimP n=1 Tax=Chitinivibrio alkaliphilus ACht1 TaxID=1313304 RepID=U7D6K7_9BACT|nr:ribosome maturation factor RimP [Chitinivibrio alkaliphilus]ERP32149.1 ribosome maturation protein RimP [Chitinivibrio alkaliphilus ACht1]
MKLQDCHQKHVEEIIVQQGAIPVEIRYFSAGGSRTLRVLADSPDGITLDRCAEISRAISAYLDEVEFGTTPYTLEVSSPGVDRPLTTHGDFARNIGRDVRIRLKEYTKKSDARKRGKIQSCTETELTLSDKGTEVVLPMDNILSGKLDI